MNMNPTNKAFAEVIESSLTGFLAQSWQWNKFPSFGSLVTISTSTRTVLGIVHQIQTGSMDPIRYPFPYQKTEEELLSEQPQIFEFLKTSFSCLTVAYQEHGTMYYMLSPEPVKIHAFVSPASEEISKQFFYNNNYLHVLFGLSHQIFNIDELLLALIRHQASVSPIPATRIAHFMETFSLLTGNDYRRLKLFLQRVEPLL